MIDPKDIGISIAKLLVEASDNTNKIVVFPGKFHPFLPDDKKIYEQLQAKFGSENVYLSMSNVIDDIDAPFTFKQKAEIITTLYNIPKEKIIKTDSPYAPREFLNTFPENTVFVLAIDPSRLFSFGRDFFKRYEDGIDYLGHKEAGYYYPIDLEQSTISQNDVKDTLGDPSLSVEEKQQYFKKIFGTFDENLFDLITNKLTSSVVQEWVIKRNGNIFENVSSFIGADDGPLFMYKNYDAYKGSSYSRLERFINTGWTIIDHLLKDGSETKLEPPMYPNGPVPAVSFFPAGDTDTNQLTAHNQENLTGRKGYNKWKKHIMKSVAQLGWTWINDKEEKDQIISQKSINESIESTEDRLKFYKKYYENITPPGFSVTLKNNKIVISHG
jgi:hypothetical protein